MTAQDPPRRLQDAPKTPPGPPKRPFKTFKRCFQLEVSSKMPPRGLQEPPRSLQDPPRPSKTLPRAPQKAPQDPPKTHPRPFKMPSECLLGSLPESLSGSLPDLQSKLAKFEDCKPQILNSSNITAMTSTVWRNRILEASMSSSPPSHPVLQTSDRQIFQSARGRRQRR